MTIASEITRINTNIASAYDAIEDKGGTIPASPNSANLATAISSISTGSNFSLYPKDYSDSEFETACTNLDTIVGDYSKTVQDLLDDGWVEMYSYSPYPSANFYSAYILSQDISTVWLGMNTGYWYKFPTGTTLDTTNHCITFTGTERWILALHPAVKTIYNIEGQMKSYSGSSSYGSPLRGVYIKRKYSSKQSVSALSASNSIVGQQSTKNLQYLRRLKINYSNGYEINWSNSSSNDVGRDLGLLTSGFLEESDVNNIVSHFAEYTDENTFIEFSGNALTYLQTGLASSTYVGKPIYGITRIPFILDYSTNANSFIYLTSSNEFSPNPFITQQVRLKLPSAGSQTVVMFNSNCISTRADYPFDLASWQYVATNAPTLTTASTIRVGGNVGNKFLDTNSAWNAVYTTLQSKNWTIDISET